MVKYVALISLCLGLIATRMVPLPYYSEPPAYGLFQLDPFELAAQTRWLDNQLHRRETFVAVQNKILYQVKRESMALMDACERVYSAAQEIYPRFNTLLWADEKVHPKRKLAWNIVEGLRLDAAEIPSLREVVERLERELVTPEFEAWLREPWQRQE